MEKLENYAFMWNEKKDEYFLLIDEDCTEILWLHDGKMGFDLIDDNELYKSIVLKLEECGNKKFNNMDEVKKYLDKWNSPEHYRPETPSSNLESFLNKDEFEAGNNII